MILRSKKIIEDSISINAEYIDPVAALIIDGVLVIILFFIGILKTKKYDYIEKSWKGRKSNDKCKNWKLFKKNKKKDYIG